MQITGLTCEPISWARLLGGRIIYMNRHNPMDPRSFTGWENLAWKLLLEIISNLQIWATESLFNRNLFLMASQCNLNDFIQYLYTLANGINSNCIHLSFLSIYGCIRSLNADRNLTGFKENCVHVSLTAFSVLWAGWCWSGPKTDMHFEWFWSPRLGSVFVKEK